MFVDEFFQAKDFIRCLDDGDDIGTSIVEFTTEKCTILIMLTNSALKSPRAVDFVILIAKYKKLKYT